MKRCAPIVLAALLAAAPSAAQDTGEVNLYQQADAPHAVIETGLVFQRYGIDYASGASRTVSQVAFPLLVSVPVRPDLTVSLRAMYASGGGDDLATLGGIADAQLGISYRHMLGPAELIASLGVGLPLGSAAMTSDELGTAILLSRNEFAFTAPSLRQGLRFAPGVTLAVPVDRNVVFGVGASYQVRQGFTPFEESDQTYTPGNELLVTAGFDVGMGGASVMSLDVSYALYGNDSFGDYTLEPGGRLSARFNIIGGIGSQQIHFLARYSHRGDGTVGDRPFETPLADEAQVVLGGLFRFPGEVGLGLGIGARYLGDFGEIGDATSDVESALALADHQLLFDLMLAPSVQITPEVRFVSSFTYSLGLGKLVDLADVTPLAGFRLHTGLSIRI
jgi:hypothetical protein